ncbi:hypothetical protein NQZ68_031285 [Dissostichus eleginoides]|nr:hypothetical protein NQZ68_031285 [Dissostichus eleginoides]
MDTLNSHHPKITLKHTLQPLTVEFLDTCVFFRESSDLTKTLSTKLIRFHRICTFAEDVEEATRTLFSALRPRGYSRRFLRSVKAEVGRTFTEKYQDTSTRPSGPALIPLITTYSSSLGSLLSGLKANFEGARADCDALRGEPPVFGLGEQRELDHGTQTGSGEEVDSSPQNDRPYRPQGKISVMGPSCPPDVCFSPPDVFRPPLCGDGKPEMLWDAASDTPPGETPSGGQDYRF